jgi:hypothetical protein
MVRTGVVHRHDEAVHAGSVCGDGLGQIGRERSNAALTGEVIPDESDSPNRDQELARVVGRPRS